MVYDDARARQLAAELSTMLAAGPGLAKGPSRREVALSKSHAAFREAVDELTRRGWSRAKIADYVGVHPVTLKDWYDAGDTKRCQIPSWIWAALPPESRTALTRAMLQWSDPPPASRTGTDDV
jgi:hypothetical protein